MLRKLSVWSCLDIKIGNKAFKIAGKITVLGKTLNIEIALVGL